MTYNLCKKVISSGNYEKVDMTQKLDVFLLNNRITRDNYTELICMMETPA